MPNITQVFKSRFLRAVDLDDTPRRERIESADTELVGPDREEKLVLHFAGGGQALILNQTNALAIAETHGEETDAWRGKTIELFRTDVPFRGKSTPAIRVRAVADRGGAAAAEDPEDDIPF